MRRGIGSDRCSVAAIEGIALEIGANLPGRIGIIDLFLEGTARVREVPSNLGNCGDI